MAQVVEDLLDTDVLSGDEWQGDIEMTLAYALINFEHYHFSESPLAMIPVDVCFTEDIDTWGFGDIPNAYLATDQVVAAFALQVNDFRNVFCETSVRKWEQRRRDLGYSLMNQARRGLQSVIGCAYPAWANEILMDRGERGGFTDGSGDDVGEDAEGEPEETFLSAREFRQGLPRKALRHIWNRNVVLRSLADPRGLLDDAEKYVLRCALELDTLLTANSPSPSYGCDIHLFDECEAVIPMALRWNEEDRMYDPIDDFNDMLQQSGQASQFVYLKLYTPGEAGSIQNVIQAFDRIGEILRLVDVLLVELDSTATLSCPWRRKEDGVSN